MKARRPSDLRSIWPGGALASQFPQLAFEICAFARVSARPDRQSHGRCGLLTPAEPAQEIGANGVMHAIVCQPEAVDDFQRARIVRALEESGGSQRKAAELLGLKESTLRYMLKKLELKPERRASRARKKR